MKKQYFTLLSFLILLSGNLKAQTTCNEPGINPGDLGCVSFTYRGNPATLTTVRGTDGKIWLQQNLGSTSVATSATDDSAYGDTFQWGRWDDGHQSRVSETLGNAPQPNNPVGLNGGTSEFFVNNAEWWGDGTIVDKWEAASPTQVTENNGCDPCKALGSAWSLPTQADWETILASENITNIATAYFSNLKLTVGGNRTSSGSFSFVGQRGYYWSKTTTASTGYAKYLYYSNAIVNAAAGGFREQGSSVRCFRLSPPVTYCNVSVDFDVEPISSVSFANINNQSSPVVGGTPAYQDFSAIIGNVNRGNSYTLIVKGNTNGQFTHDIRAFFDWNNDGVFNMATEYYAGTLAPSTGSDGIESAITLAIPADAKIGNTRMRIIKDMWNVYEEGEFDACLNAYYGQVEDYTVNIQAALSVGDFTQNTFKLYPNPTAGFITIQSDLEVKTVTVYNHLGQLVSTQNQSLVDLSNVSSGIYMVKVDFADGQTATQKVIKK